MSEKILPKKRCTLHDVAQVAGVTHTTVSLVIQGNSRISQETRDKVLAAIKALHYRPNSLARQLAGGKNNTIAVLAAFFSSHFELEFMRGLQIALGKTDYNLSQFSTRGSLELKDDIFDQLLYENRAEGIIALNLKPSPEMLAVYRKSGIPIVLIEEEMEGTIVLKSDNYHGAYVATLHLVQRGYKDIAILSGARDSEEPGSSPMERYEGYCAALKEAGREIREDMVFETEDYEIEDGMRILEKIQKEKPEIDAIFCAAGDLVAFGLLRYAKKIGISIPNDLAVIGYDDHFVAEIVSPALTTMRQPIYAMGSTALNTIVKAINHTLQPDESRIIYNAELVVRETT